MTDILALLPEELGNGLAALGFARYKAKSVFTWLHARTVVSFDEMTDLSKVEREKLKENYFIPQISVARKLVSAIDGTVKYLYRFSDGECVEAVLMKYHHANSLCISTQVGCRMGCRFCASTIAGKKRDLTASEMLNEIYMASRDSGETVGSVVLMGIGEPLDNFDNVLKFLELLSCPEGRNLSLRHVSLSTCGIVPKIYELSERSLALTLSVSLHAPNDRIRSELMPVNNKYNIDELLRACRYYFKKTGRRISYEYSLIRGVNDSPECAHELAGKLRGTGAHINLISINRVTERGYRPTSRAEIKKTIKIYEQYGITATVRRKLGDDINAACGQLRREYKSDEKGGKTQ